jgi:hypothetical protein
LEPKNDRSATNVYNSLFEFWQIIDIDIFGALQAESVKRFLRFFSFSLFDYFFLFTAWCMLTKAFLAHMALKIQLI